MQCLVIVSMNDMFLPSLSHPLKYILSPGFISVSMLFRSGLSLRLNIAVSVWVSLLYPVVSWLVLNPPLYPSALNMFSVLMFLSGYFGFGFSSSCICISMLSPCVDCSSELTLTIP